MNFRCIFCFCNDSLFKSLAVIGGARGILSQMVNSRVAPNLKTLGILMQVARESDIKVSFKVPSFLNY